MDAERSERKPTGSDIPAFSEEDTRNKLGRAPSEYGFIR